MALPKHKAKYDSELANIPTETANIVSMKGHKSLIFLKSLI